MAARDHVIKVRLSRAELALATANAEAEGVPLSRNAAHFRRIPGLVLAPPPG